MTDGETAKRADGGTTTQGALRAGDGNYFFNLDELAGIDAGPTYSTANGPVVEGERMQVGLMCMPEGTDADPHTHPNEQFTYVVNGTVEFEVDGQTETLSEGSVIYTPPDTVHASRVVGDEDLYFFVAKDLRHGIAGTPVDGSGDGVSDETSSEPSAGAGDRETKTDGAFKAGNGNYFFDLRELAGLDAGPGYSDAHGPVVEGERIQVGLMVKPPGSASDLHTHPNEQFNYTLQGTSRFPIEDETGELSEGWLSYIPPNTEHYGAVTGDEEYVFFVAKDLTHGIAGSAVED